MAVAAFLYRTRLQIMAQDDKSGNHCQMKSDVQQMYRPGPSGEAADP